MLQKKSQIVFLLLVFLPGIFGKLYGQNSQYANIAFPSAASMGLVSAVNHTTGTVNVSVPLYTLDYFGMQVPISLHYNTSGIRVTDLPTEGGYGWRLTAGGKITRVVRQRPDDLLNRNPVWGKTTLQVAEAFFKTVDHTKYENYNEVDAEPDLFYYEIPGKSGMFVLDGQRKPHTIPYQPGLVIEVANEIFTIRDNTGTVYTFGGIPFSQETTTVTFNNNNLKANNQTETQNYISTWHLASISNSVGHRIAFGYSAGQLENTASTTYMDTYENKKPTLPVSDSWEKKDSQTYKVRTSTTPSYLSRITAGPHIMDFFWSANCIGEIRYYRDTYNTKRFYFNYETFANGRVFLSQIESAGGTLTNPPRENLCSFEYNQSRLLPPHDSYDYDSWGYYNGKNNTTHLPAVTPRDIYEMSITIPGANKSPVFEYTQACILKAIVYNTGGRTEYMYGLNNHNSTDIGGLRVEKITHRDENNREVSSVRYEYGNSALGGLGMMPGHFSIPGGMGYIPSFTAYSHSFYNIYFTSGSHIMYGKITEIAPDGSKVQYDYSTPITRFDPIYANIPGTFLEYRALSGTVNDVVGTPPLTQPQTSRFWRHGLLLKTTKYDPQGNNLEETSYAYKYDYPKKTIIKGYSPCILVFPGVNIPYPYFSEYQWESQPVLLESTTTTSRIAPTVTTYNIYDTEWVVLTTTIQSTPDNSIQTTYRYAHDLTYPAGGTFPAQTLAAAGILAPVEVVTYTNGRITGAELTEYGSFPLALPSFSSVILPYKKYYLPLQSPISSLTPVNYNGSGALTYHSGYKLSQTLDYDPYGRVQTQQDPEGRINHFIYALSPDADGKIADERIAEVSNASSGSFFYEGFEYSLGEIISTASAPTGRNVFRGSSFSFPELLPGNYRLTYWKSNDSGATWHKQSSPITLPGAVISNDGWIDEVRVHPANARMTTRTYLPGVGVSSETDHNGVTTYWEYDPFGRLQRILDTDRQVVEEYEYHFKN